MLGRFARGLFVTLSVLVSWAAPAEAQVVQGCQPNQYLDRTAPGADRELFWEMGIELDPERCLQVAVGQSVFWNGDMDVHPLGAQGGDSPNPIPFHQNGVVTFNTPGTFGYKCLSHSSMIGAIKVVAGAPPVRVPSLSPWLAVAAALLLLAGGVSFLARRAGAAARS